ncbi:MAG: hypothetical protein IPN25_03170 [Sphingobacteriales bacterium]|nr:hypothetical protein [Sphingobacteriales bacterium]
MLLFVFAPSAGQLKLCAQIIPDQTAVTPTDEVVPKSLSIPPTPAFALLGITPSEVIKPGTVRDFKVDWSLKSYRLAPNLALEAQPLWLLYRYNLDRYSKASWIEKSLSTLSVSAGTNVNTFTNKITKSDSLVYQLAYALKLNLFHEKNKLVEKVYVDSLMMAYKDARKNYKLKEREVAKQLKKTRDKKKIFELETELAYAKREMKETRKSISDEYLSHADDYSKRRWNASMLEVAGGQVFSYQRETVDSLNLKRAGYGVWLNGGYGVGNNWYFTGMLKYAAFPKTDTLIVSLQPVKDILAGINIRYGSLKYNFFMEWSMDTKLFDPDLEIDGLRRNSLSFGGDLKVSPIVLLSYGIRTDFNKKLQFKNFIPIANVTCLMR